MAAGKMIISKKYIYGTVISGKRTQYGHRAYFTIIYFRWAGVVEKAGSGYALLADKMVTQ